MVSPSVRKARLYMGGPIRTLHIWENTQALTLGMFLLLCAIMQCRKECPEGGHYLAIVLPSPFLRYLVVSNLV